MSDHSGAARGGRGAPSAGGGRAAGRPGPGHPVPPATKPMLRAWTPEQPASTGSTGSTAGRISLRLLRVPAGARNPTLQLRRRNSGDHIEVELQRGDDPRDFVVDLTALQRLNTGVWDFLLVAGPGDRGQRIAARGAALTDSAVVVVGDVALTPFATRSGTLAATCRDPYEVQVDTAEATPEVLTICLLARTSVLVGRQLALDLRGLNVYGRARIDLRPEWVTHEEPDPEQPDAFPTTVAIPIDEIFAALRGDGYYEASVCVLRAAAPTLAASIRQESPTRRLRLSQLSREFASLESLPAATFGIQQVAPYRISGSHLGLRIADGSVLADVLAVTVSENTVSARLSVRSVTEAPVGAVVTNRRGGQSHRIPADRTGEVAEVTIDLTGPVGLMLAEDGRYNLGLRCGDRDWVFGIRNTAGYGNRRRWWTFPSVTIGAEPSQRLRPYFTLHDSLALLSTPLLELSGCALSGSDATGALHASLRFTSRALPAAQGAPVAQAVVWWSVAERREIQVTQQRSRAQAKGAHAIDFTIDVDPDERAALRRAARQGRMGVVFEQDDAMITGRFKIGPPVAATPTGRITRRIEAARRRIRHRSKLSLYRLLTRVLPVEPNRAVFQAFLGGSYADSPRAIAQSLHEISPGAKIVWFAKPGVDLGLPTWAKQVEIGSVEYYLNLARSRFFVANTNFPDHVIKRPGQLHLQTWHGTPLKRIGMDVPASAPGYELQDNPALHRRIARWDGIVSPSPFVTNVYRTAFRHSAQVLETGYPRNDILLDVRSGTSSAEAIRARLGLTPTDRVVLYMPTWRDTLAQAEQGELAFSLRGFAERFGSDVTLLMRLHYTVSAAINIPLDLPRIIDVSDYPDSADLLAIADVLVTDYSSVFYDFSITGRPIVFFAHDLAEYELDERGFYWDLRSFAPWPIAQQSVAFFDAVERALGGDGGGQPDPVRLQEFRDLFVPLDDGHAAERVVREFFTGTGRG